MLTPRPEDRSLRDRPLPSIEAMLEGLSLPPGVRPCGLARAAVPEVIAALADWHPDLAIGETRRIITAAFYEERATFAGEEVDLDARPIQGVLLRDGDELVGVLVLEHEAAERSLAGLISAVAPRHRGRGLGRALIQADEHIARASGAHLIYGFAELDNSPQCAALEREGRRLCAIVPESDIRRVAPGVKRYVPEGVFVKVLLPPEESLRPAPADLSPRTAVLFDLLESPAAASFGPCRPPPPPRIDPTIAALVAARPPGTWPDVGLLSRQIELPAGVTARQIRREDIPRVTDLLPRWHPDVLLGPAAHLTRASFHEATVALAGEDGDVARRPGHVVVGEKDGEIVAIAASFHDLDEATLWGEIVAIEPRHRRTGLGERFTRLLVLLACAADADAFEFGVTLRHRGGQLAAERAGLSPWGLVPAAERITVAPGVVKSGFEVLYGVSLVLPEQASWPEPSTLPPHRAAWVRFARGEGWEGGA